MTNWEEITIGDILARSGGSIKTGPFGTALKASEYSSVGVPLISVGEVGYGYFSIHPKTPRIGQETISRLPEYILEEGDIVFGRKGAVDRSAVVGPDEVGWFLGSDGIRLRLPDTCDPQYIGYWLRSQTIRDWLLQHAGGSTMASLNQGTISRIPVKLPKTLTEQKSIASVLSALDHKIELNRRMNETLEATARALFKDWFIDFGPTRTKMETRSAYLADDIWSRFPDRLDDEGKPQGWSVKPLDQVADFLNGLALQKYPANAEGFLPVIKIAQLRAGNASSADRASTTIPQNYIVEDGDVLFSWSGSLLLRIWTAGRGALNQHLFKVTSKQFPKWFFFHWIAEHLPSFQATAASKATTMGHIQRYHLTQALTVIAPPAIMDAADKLIAPLLDRQIANDLESRTLAETRDLLLPKLMSGELRVDDAAPIV